VLGRIGCSSLPAASLWGPRRYRRDLLRSLISGDRRLPGVGGIAASSMLTGRSSSAAGRDL
jgi:hypothetical protein